MSKLRGADRRYLRSQAHHLQPVVQIGKQGLTERVLATIDENLSAHELIKFRFGDFKDQKKALTAEIAGELGAEVAGLIGHIAILYRPHPESGKRKIRLPRPAAPPPNSSDSTNSPVSSDSTNSSDSPVSSDSANSPDSIDSSNSADSPDSPNS